MDFSQIFKNMGDVRAKMDAAKQRVARLSISGEAGAGLVRVTMNGEGTAVDVKIDPTLLSASSKEMLEQLILSAVNNASEKTREAVAHEMKSVMGGLNLQGLEKFLGL